MAATLPDQLIALLGASGSPEAVSAVLARTLDALPLGVNLYDASSELRVLYTNPASLRMTVPAAPAFHGRPLLEVLPGIASSPVLAMMREC